MILSCRPEGTGCNQNRNRKAHMNGHQIQFGRQQLRDNRTLMTLECTCGKKIAGIRVSQFERGLLQVVYDKGKPLHEQHLEEVHARAA